MHSELRMSTTSLTVALASIVWPLSMTCMGCSLWESDLYLISGSATMEKSTTTSRYFHVFRDHPKSYMWDKKGNPYHFMSDPSPHNEQGKLLSRTSVCISLYSIYMHHSWFTFIMFNFKYFLCEWYITTQIDFKHILFISTWVWDNVMRKVWNGLLTPFLCNWLPFVSHIQLFGINQSINQLNSQLIIK